MGHPEGHALTILVVIVPRDDNGKEEEHEGNRPNDDVVDDN